MRASMIPADVSIEVTYPMNLPRFMTFSFPPPGLRLALAALTFFVSLGAPGWSQTTASTSSIEGSVREDKGGAVKYALVTVSSAATPGAKPFLKSVPTAPATGIFRLTGLPAGTYRLCAQVPTMIYGANEDQFTDNCIWADANAPRIILTQGQAKTGAVVTLTRGHMVKVRVNDPGKLLPPPSGKHAGSALALHIAGPNGVRFIPISNTDAGGRDHSIVIPYSVAHKLAIQSNSVQLQDEKGRTISGLTPLDILGQNGVHSTSFVVNVVGKVKP